MLVEIASANYTLQSPNNAANKKRVEQIQKILSEMTIETPAANDIINISFRDQGGKSLATWDYKEIDFSYRKKDSKKLVVFDDGAIFEKEFGHYCIFYSNYAVDMKIFVDNLEDLKYYASEKFIKKIENGTDVIIEKIGNDYKKTPVIVCADLKNDEAIVHILNSNYRSLDMLLISPGVGLGLVKNTFVSSFDLNLGVGFSKKGIMKNIYFIEWNTMYDFSESSTNRFFELNHFLSLGWEGNFSNSPVKDDWWAFSIGYLVIRNNDFFKENTFRLSYKKRINDIISVKPELYFNDFFKNVYPGIRFSVSF
jgi:hypothetical protein